MDLLFPITMGFLLGRLLLSVSDRDDLLVRLLPLSLSDRDGLLLSITLELSLRQMPLSLSDRDDLLLRLLPLSLSDRDELLLSITLGPTATAASVFNLTDDFVESTSPSATFADSSAVTTASA